MDDANLIEGKRKDLQSEKHTFLRNRVAEIITETVCKLVEGHREISDLDLLDLPRRNPAKAITFPAVAEAQTLWAGMSSQCMWPQ